MFPTSFAQLLLRLSNMNEIWLELEDGFEEYRLPQGKFLPPSTKSFYLLLDGTVRSSFTTATGLEWVYLYQKKGACLMNTLC